ncbi:MAG: hypothetical protein IBX61_04130 [Thermoleophilia bacterium]|nr:hypothetical protein [Thermoleophilia bacterium]
MTIDIGRIFSTCIDYVKNNPLIFVPQVLLGVIIFALAFVIIGAAIGGIAISPGEITAGAAIGGLFLFVILAAAASFVTFGWTVSMAAEVVETGSTSLGSGFSRFTGNLGQLLLVGILLFLIIGIGTLLCVIPGIIAAFFLIYAYAAVAYGGMGAIDALKDSFSLVKEYLVDTIVLVLIAFGLSIGASIVAMILGIVPIIGALIGYIIQMAVATFILVLTVQVYRDITEGEEAPEAQPTV